MFSLSISIVGLFNEKIAKRYRYAIFAFVIISLIIILDIHPLINVAIFIPLINLFAFDRYIVSTAFFATLMLALFGFNYLYERIKANAEIDKKLKIVIAFSVLILLSDVVKNLSTAFKIHPAFFAIHDLITILCAAVLILLVYRPTLKIHSLLVYILIINVVFLFNTPQLSAPAKSQRINEKPTMFLKENLEQQRMFSIKGLMPNYGSYYGIKQINYNDLPVPKKTAEYTTKFLNTELMNPLLFDPVAVEKSAVEQFIINLDNYENAGVKYVEIDRSMNVDERFIKSGLEKVYEDETVQIWELKQYAHYLDLAQSKEVAVAEIKPINSSSDKFRVNCGSDICKLKRLELSFSGWKAFVDGKSTELRSDDSGYFQEVSVSNGEHTLEFKYQPKMWIFGIGCFFVGLMNVFALLAVFIHLEISEK